MEKYKYKVSVIVPIYNAGNHLRECLDSLVNQTLQGIQLILVLDKPTDGSEKIAKSYSQTAGLHIIENQYNIHLGKARNAGLKCVEGKYIGFCDHDDVCDVKMFERLYNIMEESEADIGLSPFVAVDSSMKELVYNDYADSKEAILKNIFLTTVGVLSTDKEEIKDLSIPKTIWNKLYRADIIKKYNINFVDTKAIAPEDTIFNIEYLCKCTTVAFCHEKLYYHVYHNNNTGNSIEYKSIIKYVNGLGYIYGFLKKQELLDKGDIRERFYNTVKSYIYTSAIVEFKTRGVISTFKKLREIRAIDFIQSAYRNGSNIAYRGNSSVKVLIISNIIKKIILI